MLQLSRLLIYLLFFLEFSTEGVAFFVAEVDFVGSTVLVLHIDAHNGAVLLGACAVDNDSFLPDHFNVIVLAVQELDGQFLLVEVHQDGDNCLVSRRFISNIDNLAYGWYA